MRVPRAKLSLHRLPRQNSSSARRLLYIPNPGEHFPCHDVSRSQRPVLPAPHHDLHGPSLLPNGIAIVEAEQTFNYLRESGYTLPEFADALSVLDTSGDGKINYNEFICWMAQIGCLDIANLHPVALPEERYTR